MKTLMKESDLSVTIIVHEAIQNGPGHDLRDFFLKKGVKKLLFIAHPLLFIESSYKNSSRFELYENGKLVKDGKARHWNFPEIVLYVKDLVYSIVWSIQMNTESDITFGVGNLNALAACLLKQLRKTKKAIYYVIDYVPHRFSNRFINDVYHSVEKIAAEKSDYTWNLSPRMINGREQRWQHSFKNQLVVPHGVHFFRIKRVSFEKVNTHGILFMGTLFEKQGVQLAIRALPKLIKKIPEIKLTIIGKGPYEESLRLLTKSLQLEKSVEFVGHIQSHEEMENRIAKAAVALALYDRDKDKNDFTYYNDPGKIKNYLGAGVPVIMTNVPYVAEKVRDSKCGMIVQYSPASLEEALMSFFSDIHKMREYRENALRFVKKYEWSTVFSKALRDSAI